MPLRPRALGAAFGLFFVVVFLLAWNVSRDLPTPWYGPDLSRWVYSTYLLGSAALLAGVVVAASRRTSSLDREIAGIDKELRATLGSSIPGDPGSTERDAVDRDIDDLLERLGDMESVSEEGEVVLQAQVLPDVAALPAVGSVSADLLAERQRLSRARRSVRGYAAGPGIVATAFLGLSGAMLPGADAFLQSLHQLNTTLILGIAYGWLGLGAYALAATFAHLQDR